MDKRLAVMLVVGAMLFLAHAQSDTPNPETEPAATPVEASETAPSFTASPAEYAPETTATAENTPSETAPVEGAPSTTPTPSQADFVPSTTITSPAEYTPATSASMYAPSALPEPTPAAAAAIAPPSDLGVTPAAVSADGPESAPVTAVAPDSVATETAVTGGFVPDYTAPSTAQQQWFYAGGDVGTTIRAEAIPGRVYYDFDGVTVKDPFDVMQSAGFNAIRVESMLGQCLGPSPPFDNSGDVLGREKNFQLDAGCIDIQVNTALLGKARNMKIVLTVNFGPDIPTAWYSYSYAQMLQAIDMEVRRQVGPFLQAGVQPDIILLENEGTSGFLFNVVLPDGAVYARGSGGLSQVPTSQVQQEICGHLPTGLINSYPQLAGYYKQEILSLTSAIQEAGGNVAATRYGLHSHGQYIDFKQSVVYSSSPDNEVTVSYDGVACDFTGIIPDNILSLRASDLLNIMGFSSYPDPEAPADPSSVASLEATFSRLNTTLGLMDKVAQSYGKFDSGMYAGQNVKQGLAVEFATTFHYPDQTADQLLDTQLYFGILKSYSWFLGALWWEPTYGFNNYEGGQAALYHTDDGRGELPTATLSTWGSFSFSPSS